VAGSALAVTDSGPVLVAIVGSLSMRGGWIFGERESFRCSFIRL
jgi:hypothetical protein